MTHALKPLFMTLAVMLAAGTAQAAPMGFNLNIDLAAPIPTPIGGPVDTITGMFTADPQPLAGPRVVDCSLGFAGCEISQLMLELSGGGGTIANVDLFMTDPLNPLGQFTGQAMGGFGTVDVTANTSFFYDIDNLACGPIDTLCNGGGFFALSLDLTGDGATGDDTNLMELAWADSPASGAPAVIFSASILGDPICNASAPCGTLDVDPKPVPVPATLLLLGLGLAGLGVRRRLG